MTDHDRKSAPAASPHSVRVEEATPDVPSAGGEHDAEREFSNFYSSEFPRIVGFVMKHGASLLEAHDAVQAAFTAAWEAWSGIREPRAWLRTVAVREYLRQPAMETPVDSLPEHSVLDTSASAHVEAGEEAARVVAALQRLPMKQRQVLAWEFDGFSVPEIARFLRTSEAAVRQNRHRARARLKAELLDATEEGGEA